MRKRVFCLIVSCLLLIGWSISVSISVIAAGSNEDIVECCFTSDSKYLKLYLNGQAKEDTIVKINSKEYQPTVSNDVEIKTTFMIDNTNSIPKSMREIMLKSIKDYIKRMPSNESVRIVAMQKFMIPLMDGYSRDESKLEHALDQLTFDHFGSYVYDCIKQAIEQLYGDDDACYRLVVVTDGCAGSGSDVSFDYLRTLIDTDNRYHVDLVQVASSSKLKEDTNMKSLAMLSSNTYHLLYEENTDLSYLTMGTLSLLKLSMDNSLTTGMKRGIIVKDSNRSIDVGSIFFPQADLGIEPPPDMPVWLLPVLIAAGAILLAAIILGVVFWWKNNKVKMIEVGVNIIKDDLRDTNDVNTFTWRFPVKGEYYVGRTLKPLNDNGTPKHKNNFAIIETAESGDKTNIGRNSFKLSYDERKGNYIITNVSETALVFLQIGDQQIQIDHGNSLDLPVQSRILIGRYTTIKIESLNIVSCSRKDLKNLLS